MESVLKGKIAPSLSARFFVGSAGKAYPADRYRLSPATAEIPGAQKGVTAHLYHVLVSLGTVGAPGGSILAAVRSGERGHLPLLTGERAPFAILDQLSCWYPACTADLCALAAVTALVFLGCPLSGSGLYFLMAVSSKRKVYSSK